MLRVAALAVCTILAACASEASNTPDDDTAPVSTTPKTPASPSGDTKPDDPQTDPPPRAKPVPGLRAEYFDGYHDMSFGTVEPNIDHAWGDNAPAMGIGKDRFSARWTGTLTAKQAGKTTIGIDGDDGARVWIDGKLVIDDWRAHFEERHTAEVTLDPAKPVAIRVDYFEADLDAQIRLWWSADGLAEEPVPAGQFTTIDLATGIPGPKPPIANPVIAKDCPDPGVLADGGSYYLACTGGKFGIKQSRDLVTWAAPPDNPAILADGKAPWAINGSHDWAPEIHKLGDKNYVAYFTSWNDASVLSLGLATAESPLGPFTPAKNPLLENALGVIDATQFTDDDGSKWLIYKIDGNSKGKPTPILVRKLTADGTAFAAGSTAKQILVNDPATWEGGVVEAPWVVKRDGKYFLIYSGNVYDARYRTGVARATSLTGTWEKKGAPILANNATWVGPGHGSVVAVPTSDGTSTQDYFVYHAWKNDGAGNAGAGGRQVLLDRIKWVNGWPQIGNGTPTAGSQPWPGEDR